MCVPVLFQVNAAVRFNCLRSRVPSLFFPHHRQQDARPPRALSQTHKMEIQVGQAVELMAVENAGIDITGKRGVVTAIPGHGLVSVALDGGAVVSAWPENLKILRSSDPAPATHTTNDRAGSEPAAKGE